MPAAISASRAPRDPGIGCERIVVRAFLAWWLGQLAELLPRWLRRPAAGNADALVIEPVGPLGHAAAVTVILRRNGSETLVGQFPFADRELKGLPDLTGQPVALRLSAREVLEKTLVLPLAAQADLEQVLAFEMDRETPFTPEELYWKYRITKTDRQLKQLHVSLSVLPKIRLAPIMAALASAGLTPAWVEPAESARRESVLQLDGARERDRSSRLFVPAAVCCVLLGMAAAATPFIRQAVALGVLGRELQIGRRAADKTEALRREIDRLSRSADLVNSEVMKSGRPLEVLAAVTRALPDDTYLTEFELREGKLTLSGRSAAAASLIGALAIDGGFQNPAFAAPVTRLEAVHAEVFTIVADVGPSP
jgi:general secretion pathway protein L